MNGNHIPTVLASVLFRLTLKKLNNAFFSNLFKIFNHAHVISFLVAIIKVSKVFAWHRIAFITRSDLVISEFFASAFDVAVFRPRNTTCTIRDFTPHSWYSTCISDVSSANSAIHSTWRNKFRKKNAIYH